jgi:hypothetical protein
MADSVGLAFPREVARCMKLLRVYEELGPIGAFGHTMIRGVVAEATRAWESGDPVLIIKAFDAMRGCS